MLSNQLISSVKECDFYEETPTNTNLFKNLLPSRLLSCHYKIRRKDEDLEAETSAEEWKSDGECVPQINATG